MHQHIQTIHINNEIYSADMAKQTNSLTPSPLQALFIKKYGKDSFYVSLADFLAEWFDDNETIKVHTSGSTGTPKELFVEKQRMLNSARATISFLGLHFGDTALLCMPLPYIAGKMVVVRSLTAGLNIQPVTPCGHPLHDLTSAPDFAAMTPMQVFNTLKVPEEKERLMQVRHLIIGGGAINPEMAAVLRDFPNAVWSTYGMTETLSHIALRRLSGKDASNWYTPFDGIDVSCSAEDTLIIKAPSICPDTLYTNDIVAFNEQGQFRILGRKDNTINSGGIKIQIEEIENALHNDLTIPFMITSAPDSKFGEHIVLLIETNQLSTDTFETIFAKLPPYWKPKEIITVDKLPLTGTGKPDRATAKHIASNQKTV